MLRKLLLPLLLVAVLAGATGCSIPDQIRFWFAQRGASPAQQEKAVDVAWCESRHNPGARSGQFAGLFQIGRQWHEGRANRLGFSWGQMYEPGPNIIVAADLWAEQGWRPWTCA